jgi:exonuclease III
VFCLQDVHWDKRLEKMIRSEWGYDCYIAGYTSNSRGVAVLFNNTFEFTVNHVELDENGLAMNIHTNNLEITLICLYGPNKDTPVFYTHLKDVVNNFNNPLCIMCGDWNLVQDPINDTYNYNNINNPQARETVLKIMEELNLCDPWRIHFPGISRYTWRRENPVKQARLDFFLISSELLNIVDFVDIQPGYRTDHSAVVLHLRLDNIKPGKGTWKFNNSLLTEDNFLATIRESINKVKRIYASTPYNPENVINIPHDLLDIMINDQLFFEMLLIEIRGESIAYATKRKKDMDKVENELYNNICELELDLSKVSNDEEKTNEIATSLKLKKIELENLRCKKLSGTFIRSKARWIEHGEKPTKYFLNLEKRNFINKKMGLIVSDNGDLLCNQEGISAEVTRFYKQLYSRLENRDTENLNNLDRKKLTIQQAQSIEGILTLEELTASLNNMKSDKSPGPDGFTVEFYKAFWPECHTLYYVP